MQPPENHSAREKIPQDRGKTYNSYTLDTNSTEAVPLPWSQPPSVDASYFFLAKL